MQDQGGNENGRADLERPADHDDAPRFEQPFEREFEADGKEQEDDAYLADGLDGGLVADNREGIGAGEHADDQKTDNARDLKMLPEKEECDGENAQADNGENYIHGGSHPVRCRVISCQMNFRHRLNNAPIPQRK